jgi:hypothetical protein
MTNTQITNLRHLYYIIPFGLLLILLTACQNDNLDIPDTGRKIVINGLITTDSLLNVRIGKSAYYNENTYVQYCDLDNAQAYFYLNSLCIDSLHFVSSLDYSDLIFFYPSNYWSRNVFPLPGREYKVVAKAPGLPDATASTTVPDLIRIDGLDTTRILVAPNPYYPDLSNVRMICKINFTDPGNEINYYLVTVCKISQYWYTVISNIRIDTQDPIVEEKLANVNGVYAIAFPDKVINGKKCSLQFSIDANEIGMPFVDDRPRSDGIPYLDHKKVVYFRLYSITEGYYRYIQTLNLYKKNYGNPLTEPVMIYSNINGGYGIFTAAAVSSDSLVFHY